MAVSLVGGRLRRCSLMKISLSGGICYQQLEIGKEIQLEGEDVYVTAGCQNIVAM
jgi:hypothetical protein